MKEITRKSLEVVPKAVGDTAFLASAFETGYFIEVIPKLIKILARR